MGQDNTVRGEGRRRRPSAAQDLGWDDSLYEEDAEAAPKAAGADRGGESEPNPEPGPHRGSRRHRPAKKKKKRSKGVRILKWTALSLAVIILGAAGAGYLYYQHLNSKIKKDDLNLGTKRLDKAAPNEDGQTPLNILMLGSDSRNSKANLKLGGARQTVGEKPRADVQMLVHVSADRSNMSVLSIPRDTRVKIPECKDKKGKVYPETTREIINASMQHGGPGCTVATWEELTGIPIDHFMEIEFSGVVDMADAVGGVPVCVQDNVYDKSSGLRLHEGETYVKGQQALQWLRTRHGFLGQSDIARARAQHIYMGAMVRQLKSGAKLTDPGKLMDLAEAAIDALTVDRGLGTVKKLYDLGNTLKEVPSKRITMTTMPWLQDPQNPQAHVIPAPDAEKVFSLIRNDIALDGKDKLKKPKKATPPPAAPKDQIPVTVQNGTSTISLAPVPQRATAIASVLVQDGFSKAVSDRTPKSQADTTITYPKKEMQGDALAVAKALGIPSGAVRMSTSVAQVTLVVGSDWREGSAYPKGAHHDSKDENKAPESADLLSGDKKDCMPIDPGHRF
ncbi:LCP family protein [Streptomyces palmae]|uniref:LytR family transcriptional regulator n=1 Tax=Streptomyces palmae TaxID=1701085 RepID=A0A4Z0GNY1_9ACTN|nr:LCP family protein [Streptomyces palmae]TGA97927.1 LytR family transcriptional regulator [Streptomyces palmae]